MIWIGPVDTGCNLISWIDFGTPKSLIIGWKINDMVLKIQCRSNFLPSWFHILLLPLVLPSMPQRKSQISPTSAFWSGLRNKYQQPWCKFKLQINTTGLIIKSVKMGSVFCITHAIISHYNLHTIVLYFVDAMEIPWQQVFTVDFPLVYLLMLGY